MSKPSNITNSNIYSGKVYKFTLLIIALESSSGRGEN
jgi:hypothetical protein